MYEGTPYPLLRHLTLPVAAITTSAQGRANGFVVNSAQRASLVPTQPRISLYVSKTNFSHDLVWRSGLFVVHLLGADQFDVIAALGLRSGRDVSDKFADLDTRPGMLGCPVLEDCVASFECRVVNAMDAGGATFFLGDVVNSTEGDIDPPIMTSTHFRAAAPTPLRQAYEARLAEAQRELERISGTIKPRPWPGATARP